MVYAVVSKTTSRKAVWVRLPPWALKNDRTCYNLIMSEKRDATMADILKNVPTKALINLLQTRNLTAQDVSMLQSLRHTESVNNSQTTIATGDPKETTSAEKFAKAVN